METMVRQHQWVKFEITPISVLPGTKGEPVVVVDPDKQEAATEATVYGCMACMCPLDADLLGTECAGESED